MIQPRPWACSLVTAFDESAGGWARRLYAFLVEKQRRSGSMRTVEGYSRMLQDFFGRLGKLPDAITAQDVFAWAHGVGLSGREPSAATIGACVSSFFRFLIRIGIVASNPCDRLERPKAQPSPPRGLSADPATEVEVNITANYSPSGTYSAVPRSRWCSRYAMELDPL